MRLARAGTAALAVGVLAVAVSGCVVFQGPVKVKQKGDKPKAIVTFKVCMSDSDTESTCPDFGNSNVGDAGTGDYRVLVGLRYSKGAKAPSSIEPRVLESGHNRQAGFSGSPTLTKSPSYTAELKEKAPGNLNKYKWVGYASQSVNFSDDITYGAYGKFRIKLELKDKLIGEKLKVRPVVGVYQVSDAQPADGPIDCGDDPFEKHESGSVADNYGDGTFGICIDSPAPDEFTNAKVKIKG
jgi:hypothetical protein